MRLVELQVPDAASGSRLDAWLANTLDQRSRAQIARLIDDGLVRVDGSARTRSFRLEGGEQVVLDEPESPPSAPAAAEPRVVHEDDVLLVIDKPAGLVVHPAPGHGARTLVDQLRDRSSGRWEPELVHRLDRDTSGLMLVAKSVSARDELQRQLRAGTLTREYLALAAGRFESRTGTIDAPLGRDRSNRTRMSIDTAKPRDAITHFEVDRVVGDDTLLKVRLETGRTHQIRAHLAAIGHPICGDREYGGADRLGLARQFLHSARIAFAMPQTGSPREFSSPLPDDLRHALDSAAGR